MAAPKIQISVQGGGAKFASLLPAVDAALKADDAKIVKITRASGSSAGAIAAALIAARADFNNLDQALQDPQLQSLTEALNDRIPAILQKGRLRRTAAFYGLAKSLIAGNSIEDIQKLRKLLEYLFQHLCGFIPTDFEALQKKTGIALRVTVSDILGQQGRLIDRGPVIDAIMDSCALPFFYRNYADLKSNSVIDGGICDNLPVQHLLDEKKLYGDIFAFCLKPTVDSAKSYPMPQNIFSYAWSIWSAVTTDAIKRTKSTLNSSNIIELTSDISLTDFKLAIQSVKDREKYEVSRDNVLARFMDFAKLKSFGDISEKITVSGHIDPNEMMSAVYQVYKAHFSDPNYTIKKSSYIVRADCLDKFTGIKSRRADQVTRETVLQLNPDPNASVTCIRSFIDTDLNGLYSPTRWSAEFVKSKRKIRPLIIPADDPSISIFGSIDCLLFFEEPLKVSREDGDLVRISSHYAKSDAMLPLERDGSDFIASQNGHSLTIGRVDLILCVPKSVGQIAVAWDPAKSSANKGQPIPVDTLMDDYRFFQNSDYNVFGYSAEQVLPGEQIGARFTKVGP